MLLEMSRKIFIANCGIYGLLKF